MLILELREHNRKEETMSTVHSLATEMSAALETRTRDNGEKFVSLKDGSPEWMKDVCHDAHGDLMPDDWRYSFIEGTVNAIADSDPDDDPYDAIGEMEPDVYTGRLTAWLASRVDRVYYLTEAMEESPGITDGFTLLTVAQGIEMRETADAVLQALTDLAEDEDEDDNSCDQCAAVMINGTFCHETGCPNTRKVKVDGCWIMPEDEDE